MAKKMKVDVRLLGLGENRASFVEDVLDGERWLRFLDREGIWQAALDLRRLIAELGHEEQERGVLLGLLRDDPEVGEQEYEAAAQVFREWKRPAFFVRREARNKLASIQPSAQHKEEDWAADRAALRRLAKEVWMSLGDGDLGRLDRALNDLTISSSSGPRTSLRTILREMKLRGEI